MRQIIALSVVFILTSLTNGRGQRAPKSPSHHIYTSPLPSPSVSKGFWKQKTFSINAEHKVSQTNPVSTLENSNTVFNTPFLSLNTEGVSVLGNKDKNMASFAKRNDGALNRTSISIDAGVALPAADLADRFGTAMRLGGGIEFLSFRSLWWGGINAHFIFGQNVKEDVLKSLRTTEGAILTDVGSYADVFLKQRGLQIMLSGGKILKLRDNGNRLSGIRLGIGAGWLQHHINIQDESRAVPALFAPYTRGYDRFTGGFALSQSIGYQIISRDKTLNLFFAFESTQAFSKNLRGFNFDTRSRDDKKRIDILYGVSVGLAIPIISGVKAESIEY